MVARSPVASAVDVPFGRDPEGEVVVGAVVGDKVAAAFGDGDPGLLVLVCGVAADHGCADRPTGYGVERRPLEADAGGAVVARGVVEHLDVEAVADLET